MWESLLLQNDMTSSWSLQQAGMALRMEKALPKLKKKEKDNPAPKQQEDTTNIAKLKRIYSEILKTEHCALWPNFGKAPLDEEEKTLIKQIVSGQANYAYLRRLNKIPVNERPMELFVNYDDISKSTTEMSKYVTEQLPNHEDPIHSLLNGDITRDYLGEPNPPKKKNIIAEDDDPQEELIDTSVKNREKQNKDAKKKKSVSFKDNFTEITQIESFKAETAKNTSHSPKK
ncbi:MAG: hypothetical protein Q4B50_00230 [Bacillota bacterium]|nr:hypothetical protein [Bacillota bacterium]